MLARPTPAPPSVPTPGLARLLLRLAVTSALAAALVSLLDTAWALGASSRAAGFGGGLRLALSLAALALVPGVLVGLIEGALVGGLSGAGVLRWLRSCRADPARDRGAAAWLLAAALGAVVFAGTLAWLAPRLFTFPADAPARAGVIAMRGLLLAGISLALLIALGLATWTLARGLRGLLAWVPPSRRFPLVWAALALTVAGGLTGAGLVLAPRADLLLALDLPLVGWVAGTLGIQLILLWGWARLAHRLWANRARVWTTVALAVLLAGSVPVAIHTLDEPELLSIAFRRAVVGRRLLSLWRHVLDFDSDGYSAYLGGGDCDDSNPAIHPGARDVPGNGIDEDCSGTDARRRVSVRPAPKPSRRPTGTSFLVITIDTLRADRLGAYGYPKKTTPRLDRFAKSAVVFERAFAPANHTPRSIPAMLVGRYPSRLSWKRVTNYPPLAKGVATIATRLKKAGYRTAGIFSHWYFHRRRNLHRSFDVWDLSAREPEDDGSAITGSAVTRRALVTLRHLATGPAPFFLWVHYYEPHFPYVEHDGPDFGGGMKGRYDGEIHFVDTQVGKLLGELGRSGAAAHTAVMITSDHGEAFGEHGKHWHGHALYNEQVHVPLLVRAPAVAAGRVKTPVSTVDMVPTILELAGLKETGDLDGRSLVPVARGVDRSVRPVFLELLAYPNFPRTMRAVILGDLKLIHDVSENRFELYDLAGDPGENRDLLGDRPREAARLKTLLSDFADGARVASVDK